MADAGELKARATLDNAEFLGALKEMVNKVGESSAAASSQLDAIVGGFAKITSAVAGLAALGGVAAFAQNLLDVANKTDKLAAAFNTLNGATDETKKVFEEISGLELTSMFDFEDTLGPAAKNMMLLGVSADQTAKTMTALVDAASALKQGPGWIDEVSGAIARMQSHLVATPRDMKALSQQGIDAFGALAKEIGTSVPEAIEKIKKGEIESQTVTDAVTKDLKAKYAGAALETTTTWRGAMHVLSEATEDAQAAIGRTLAGALKILVPILQDVSAGIETMVKWWNELAEPVRTAVVVVTAALTAAVSLTAALPALSFAFTALGAGISASTLGIGAVVAALALLGKWVYDNWPAIKAVFAEIGTVLSSAFGDIGKAATTAWEWIKTTFGGLGEWIGGVLSGVGTALGTFFTLIGNAFGKLPGGEEIKKIGEVWKTAQEGMDKAAQAAKASAAARDADATAATKQAAALKQQEAAEVAAAATRKANAEATKKANEEAQKAAKESARLIAEDAKITEELSKAKLAYAISIQKGYNAIEDGARKIVQITVPLEKQLSGPILDAIAANKKLEDAYKTLHVTSTVELEAQAKAANDAFQTISRSGTASADDIKAAWNEYIDVLKKVHPLVDEVGDAFHDMGLKTATEWDTMVKTADHSYQLIADSAGVNSVAAQQAWITATKVAYEDILQQGGTLTEGQKSELDRAETMVQEHLDKVPSMWKTAYDGVKSAVGGAFDDLIEKLVTGKGSFKEIITGLWNDIASAALHTFLDPVKKAVSEFVAKELADLLGGKGLGGVLDGLKNIGASIGGVFGGKGGTPPFVPGGGGVPSVPSVPSVPGVGGAGGGLGGAAGGLMGFLGPAGAIGSIVGAVSGIIGNFQKAKMEKTLNAIEESTRYSALYLGKQSDGGILAVLWKIDEEIAFGFNTKATESLRDLFKDWSGDMWGATMTIRDTLVGYGPYITDIKTAIQDLGPYIADIKTAVQSIVEKGGQSLTINISPQGLTTAEAARALGNQIATNLQGQLTTV